MAKKVCAPCGGMRNGITILSVCQKVCNMYTNTSCATYAY